MQFKPKITEKYIKKEKFFFYKKLKGFAKAFARRTRLVVYRKDRIAC